ncbi:MAG: isochorismate synthase MenF [Candidatus Limnocylindria bacterium]
MTLVDAGAGTSGVAGVGELVIRTDAARAFDPIALYAAGVEAGLEAALWMRPSEDLALVGLGRAWAVDAEGDDRFATAGAAWRALIADLTGRDRIAADDPSQPRGVGPVLLGGLGFTGRVPAADDVWAPFGAASLVLPAFIAARTADGAWITTTTAEGGDGPGVRRWDRTLVRARELTPAPTALVARPVSTPLRVVEERPDRALWDRTVGLFAGAVGRGRMDKVVLARRVVMASPADLDVENALRRLAASAPESTVFAFRRGSRTFLGATPERLIRTAGRSFHTVAIAGSIRRGAAAEEDAALAAELLASEKDREEHAVVVAALRDRLAPICERLDIEPRPRVIALRSVQHLITEISGTVRQREDLLALAGRLHPTPAVGGEPRDLALTLIDEHEGFDRGWYAGPIGWLGADGDGEMMVALRSGVVDHTRATLFAGCGIVADSDAAREWDESRLKLRVVAAALGRPGDEP